MTESGPLNILYINSSSVLYGAETRLIDILDNLDREKFKVYVLLHRSGPLEQRLCQMGVEVFTLDYKFKITASWRNLLRFLNINRSLVVFVKKKRINLIHANLHFFLSNFWLAFLILKLPLIIHVRGLVWIHFFEKLIMSRCAKVICVSEAVKKALGQRRRSDFVAKINPDKITVIYDAIDARMFSGCPLNEGLRNELGLTGYSKSVALIGAIDPVKGQDIFIRSARIILSRYPGTKFLLVGDNDYSGSRSREEYYLNLTRMIKEFGLQENIAWLGFRKDVPAILSFVDVVVLPSRLEGLGTVLIESMAAGKPVVGTRVGGIPEVIGEDEAGIVLQERTPECLADAVNFLFDNPEECRRRGENGRRRVLKYFDIDKMVKHVEAVYLEVVDGYAAER